jgi:SM-20-related protein
MITVRGRCQGKDGRIHTDSTAKLVTALLYFNESWEAKGGRLRLLRRPDDLNDIIAEVPPDSGTLVAFRRCECSFHGHEPFVGVRRYVMINWMASTFAAKRELLKHRLSATAKRSFARAETA